MLFLSSSSPPPAFLIIIVVVVVIVIIIMCTSTEVNVTTVEDATRVAKAQMTLQRGPPPPERKAPRFVQPPAPVHEAQVGGTAK